MTPLCTQVTYEGLLDDTFGISSGKYLKNDNANQRNNLCIGYCLRKVKITDSVVKINNGLCNPNISKVVDIYL